LPCVSSISQKIGYNVLDAAGVLLSVAVRMLRFHCLNEGVHVQFETISDLKESSETPVDTPCDFDC